MEEIFVNLRIHGTSMHWSQDMIIKIRSPWNASSTMKMLISKPIEILTGKSKSKSHWSLLLDTLFIIIYLCSKPSVAWSSDLNEASNFRQGPDLLQSKSPLSFSHLKLGKQLPLVSKHNPPLKNGNKDSKDRTVRKMPCLIRFNHFSFLKQKLKKWVKGSLKWTSGQWLNDPQILVSFNPWQHTQGLWFKFKSCQHIEEAEGAVGAYRVAKIAVTSRGARAGGLVNK